MKYKVQYYIDRNTLRDVFREKNICLEDVEEEFKLLCNITWQWVTEEQIMQAAKKIAWNNVISYPESDIAHYAEMLFKIATVDVSVEAA